MVDALMEQIIKLGDPVLIILLIGCVAVIRMLYTKGKCAEDAIILSNKERREEAAARQDEMSRCKDAIQRVTEDSKKEVTAMTICHKEEIAQLITTHQDRILEITENHYRELKKRDEDNNRVAESFRQTVENFNRTIENNNEGIGKVADEVHKLNQKVDDLAHDMERKFTSK